MVLACRMGCDNNTILDMGTYPPGDIAFYFSCI